MFEHYQLDCSSKTKPDGYSGIAKNNVLNFMQYFKAYLVTNYSYKAAQQCLQKVKIKLRYRQEP